MRSWVAAPIEDEDGGVVERKIRPQEYLARMAAATTTKVVDSTRRTTSIGR